MRRHQEGFAERQVDAVALYQQGYAIRQVAKALNCRRGLVHEALTEAGVSLRGRAEALRVSPLRHRFSEEQEQEIVVSYRAGRSINALAAERGCTHAVIRDLLVRRNEPRRSRGNSVRGFSPEQVDEMARRWQAGESQDSIRLSFGASQLAVSRALRLRGIVPTTRLMRGERHSQWKGGRIVNAQGYVSVLVDADSPFASMRNVLGYVQEHRLVMAQQLGRPLLPTEQVHHIDGNRQHNLPENLELRSGPHGKGTVLVCADCGSHNIVSESLAREPN